MRRAVGDAGPEPRRRSTPLGGRGIRAHEEDVDDGRRTPRRGVRPRGRAQPYPPPTADWAGYAETGDEEAYVEGAGSYDQSEPRARRGGSRGAPARSPREAARGRAGDEYDARGAYADDAPPRRRPASRGRPSPTRYDERDAESAYTASGYREDARRAPAERRRGTNREQWVEWRDTAARFLSSAVPVPGSRGRRFPVALLLALALLGALAVGGVFLGPTLLHRLPGVSTGYSSPPGTYTPGPTPPPQPGFKKFVSSRSNYSMDYPQSWIVSSEQQTAGGKPDALDIFTPQTSTGLESMLVEQPAAAANSPDAAIIASEVVAAEQSGATFAPTSTIPIQINIGGEFWQRLDYTVTSSGQTSHEAIFAGHHEGRAYVLVLAGAANAFAADYSADFAPALASFRFNG